MEERTYVEINLAAIKRNLIKAANKMKLQKIMAVVKADGYGHGAIPISRFVDDVVQYFGVAIPEEGAMLRVAGITKPILILGITAPAMYKMLFEYDLTPTVSTLKSAMELSALANSLNKSINVHIAVDTGMSRIGFLRDELEDIESVFKLKGINVTGIFTHYACADELDKTSANNQFDAFSQIVEILTSHGFDVGIRHISNSAGIIEFNDKHFDMGRAGIMIYGLYPSDEVSKEIGLEAALKWVARISHVKTLPTGFGVSYGSTFVTNRETRIATIPLGYADGYPRALSSKGKVLVAGQFAPILGRVCMDQFMIDVTDIPDVKPGDQAILVGKSSDNAISVETLANAAFSFNYEFVCGIANRVPRIYVSE
ncbi:MAG: alanine racemase [Christensenellaceae bacterium]|jgi:alanine racemase|nr:alanine racemase [Christensenellaceae bacterium]